MPEDDPAPLVTEAIHNYFEYKSERSRQLLRLLLQEGRTSLLVGLGFLVITVLGVDILSSSFANSPFLKY